MGHLYTPTGTRNLTPETVELPWGLMERFIGFAHLAQQQGIGIHCAKCQQDVLGTNSDHDAVLTMKCGCREWWSASPSAHRV